jgi:hypothetical protein
MAAIQPQNWKQRLEKAGQTIEERTSSAARNVAQNVSSSANISVDGLANAIEGAATELKGATVDIANSANGLTGKSITDSIGQGIKGIGTSFINNIKNELGGLFGNLLGGLMQGGSLSNELDQFASYNYIITLGVLTPFEVNFPSFTYRVRDPFFTVIRSGGGQTRGSRIFWEQDGKTEYFIDNLEVDSVIAPTEKTRLTNATSFEFDVLEPYSMGNFLQSLQVAAISAGYNNYIEAPFVISIQFKGYDDFGRPITAPGARRVYPIKLVDVQFNVDESGSKYKVQAIPFNETGLTDENQSTHSDMQIVGRTVAEMVSTGAQSLVTLLNDRELKKKEAGQIPVANQYAILFPKDTGSVGAADFAPPVNNDGATTQSSKDSSSDGMRELDQADIQRLYTTLTGVENGKVPASMEEDIKEVAGIVIKRSELGEQIREFSEDEENINTIGLSKMVKTNLDGGKMPMAKPGLSEKEDAPGEVDRCRVQRSQDVRTMSCSSGKRVQDIIEQVILASEYGRQVATAKADQNGMVDWFRIESQVYLIDDPAQSTKTGEYAKIFVYRVVPYKVHRSTFQSPTQATPGIDNLKTQAVKEYNYIYTGKNKDIVDFDIRFDFAFFTAYQGDFGQTSSNSVQGGAQELAGGNTRSTTGIVEGDTNTLPTSKAKPQVPKPNNIDVGGVALHPENIVGMNFNEALVNSPVDLMMVDLTIHGDPYYIADSGMGNYSSGNLETLTNILSNGQMNYQNGEVDIILNFRTPIDYGPDGYMEFPGMGFLPVRQFSGLYKVLFVSNSFREGEFTQKLELVRRRNQDIPSEATSETEGLISTTDSEKQVSETPEAKKKGTEGASTGGTGGQSSQGSTKSSAPASSPRPKARPA